MDINTQEPMNPALPKFGEDQVRNTLQGATKEEIENVFTEFEDPTNKEKMEQLRQEQQAQQLKEIRELEEKNDQVISKFMTKLMLELIRLHPSPGEHVDSNSYLAALNANYTHLAELIEDAHPDLNPQQRTGLALHLYAKTLEELHASDALNTARILFMESHPIQEEEIPEESIKEIEAPLKSSTTFKGFEEDSAPANPAMFRLEDLQKGSVSQKKDETQKAA